VGKNCPRLPGIYLTRKKTVNIHFSISVGEIWQELTATHKTKARQHHPKESYLGNSYDLLVSHILTCKKTLLN
jgi:hypothetical protein